MGRNTRRSLCPHRAPQHRSSRERSSLFLSDGSTLHLNIRPGDVFSRIIAVGPRDRAERIAKSLDHNRPIQVVHSSHSIHIYSGYYAGVGISIIACGMGGPAVEASIREVALVQQGPLAIIRLGTCGLFNKDLIPGTIVTAGKGSLLIHVNYNHYHGSLDGIEREEDKHPYSISSPILGDSNLNALLMANLQSAGIAARDGSIVSAETFYSCQGRPSSLFKDHASPGDYGLCEIVNALGVDAMDMETHQLFHMARLRYEPLYVAAAAIAILHRTTDTDRELSAEMLHAIEVVAGKAILQTLINFKV